MVSLNSRLESNKEEGEEEEGRLLPTRMVSWSRAAQTCMSRILRLIDSCITQLKAQGPSMTCNESKEEEEGCLGIAWSASRRVSRT